MYHKIFFLSFVLNVMLCSAALSEEFEEVSYNSGNAPFFELPCMIVGGTCARSVACPSGTRVGARGLCPVQQQHGMECCKPTKVDIKCRSRGGECVSDYFKCPHSLRIKDATDCEREQSCCAFVK